MSKEKGRKSLISKTLQRCRSIGRPRQRYAVVAPEGYLSVYVGAEGERFVVRTKQVNHPLFRELLDEAEMAYGYKSDGPLKLPCDVELFHHILWQMEEMEAPASSPLCTFTAGRAPGYHVLSPYRPGRFSI